MRDAPRCESRARYRTLVRQSMQARRQGSDPWSSAVMGAGPILERIFRRVPPGTQRTLEVRVGNVPVAFRLNAGDIQGVREVFVDEVYRLPFSSRKPIRSIVDLGANIGLTALYYSAQYPACWMIAVEPDPGNAALARRNLISVGVEVVEAAAASTSGRRRFKTSRESNLGRVDDHGDMLVQSVTMDELIQRVPGGRIDLLKVDIEGGEAELFGAGCSWLKHVGAIIMEIHPQLVDAEQVICTIRSAGFRYVPAGSVWPGSMDAFVRGGDA